MSVIEMQERKASVWERMKTLRDTERRGQKLSAADEAEWDRLEAEIADLDQKIKSAIRAERVDLYGSVTDGEDAEDIRSFAHGDGRRVLDVELPRGAELRDLLKGAAATGGATVPTGFVRQLYEHLIASSAIRKTNVTVLVTDSGEDLSVPKTTAHSAAGSIVAEGATIGEADPAFATVTLQSFKYANLVQLSRELLEDTGVDLVGYLARQGGRALGNGSGAHFITGTGTGQPRGVQVAATTAVTGASGATTTVTPDHVIDLWASVIPEYRERGTWLMASATWAFIRKLKDTTNNYLVDKLGAEGDLRLLGRPIVIDPNMPVMAASAKSILFGDFSAYYIRDVRSIRIERSDDFAFANDLATFRFIQRTDGDLVDETGAIKAYANAAS